MKFKGLPESVPSTEFSEPFAQAMADRMAVSYFKYGNVADAYPHKVSAIDSLRKRLDLYVNGGEVKGQYCAPGNTEWLADVANFAMIEFMHPSIAGAEFIPQDSDMSPGRSWKTGDSSEKRNVSEFQYRREGD